MCALLTRATLGQFVIYVLIIVPGEGQSGVHYHSREKYNNEEERKALISSTWMDVEGKTNAYSTRLGTNQRPVIAYSARPSVARATLLKKWRPFTLAGSRGVERHELTDNWIPKNPLGRLKSVFNFELNQTLRSVWLLHCFRVFETKERRLVFFFFLFEVRLSFICQSVLVSADTGEPLCVPAAAGLKPFQSSSVAAIQFHLIRRG